jgi:hypothetical protein
MEEAVGHAGDVRIRRLLGYECVEAVAERIAVAPRSSIIEQRVP